MKQEISIYYFYWLVVYLQESGKQPFQLPDIWHTDYAIENVQKLFSKPDPTDKSTMDEYNKFFRQPLKMLAAAGVLRENGKKKNTMQFSVENEAVLEYLSLRERNCLDFLCSYITKTLKDSGLWDSFASFFDEQTKENFKNAKVKTSSAKGCFTTKRFCILYGIGEVL
jgi:hypothetical protein